MTDRRTFITGMLAAGLVPQPTWATVGSPAFVSAGKTPEGTHVLCGLGADGQITFQLPMPARGHAAAAHPVLALAVAFARRPGTFAIVVDCATGFEKTRLQAPAGRHFYGHGTFSADGSLLFTTENDFDAARGVVGVWDARNGYRRVAEFASGGVGPHDLKLLPDGQTLVVANGGIETHPDAGRAKLNLPTMRSNLSYLNLDGQIIDTVALGPAHQRNSIRHLAVAHDGTVAFAMQWQGDLADDLPLLGVHNRGAGTLTFLESASVRAMRGYLGSVAIAPNGKTVATTSPRAGVLQVFHDATLKTARPLADVCGVAATDAGFFVTTGTGLVTSQSGAELRYPVSWDNHLVAI